MAPQIEPRFLLQFAPEHWTPSGKFLRFLGPPFKVSRPLNEAIRSCAEHTEKFEIFATLASDIQPTLALDREELDRNGHTPARRSRQFAAVIEVLVCELYSILDGIRYTVFSIYRNCRGVQQGSTSKLFSKAALNSYGPEFPEHLRSLLATANQDWFPELRRLRTEFTHGGLGSCSISRTGDKISYINSSLGTDAVARVIDDIVSHVNHLSTSVFSLVHAIFGYLYSQLELRSSNQMCGIYKHRFYMREVAPAQDINRQSGVCASRHWFESEAGFRCPLTDTCEAYKRSAA